MITIVEPGWSWIDDGPYFDEITRRLELAGRTCYKSEERITDESADKFVRMICRNNHVSVLEHESISVRIVCSRACSHQIVRHRLASYSQESQRYCNYGKKDSFKVICPPSIGLEVGEYKCDQNLLWHKDGYYTGALKPIQAVWLKSINDSCQAYTDLVLGNWHIKPEDARFVLPNASKTEIVMTANLRMWRHIFQERALNPHAQWEIRGIFGSLYDRLCEKLPAVFGDL